MKITIVLGAFFPVPPTMGGAVEKIWFALAQEFVRRGHEVVVVSRKLPNLPRDEVADGLRHLRVRGFDAPRSLIWLKFLDLLYSVRVVSVLPRPTLSSQTRFGFRSCCAIPAAGKCMSMSVAIRKGKCAFIIARHGCRRHRMPSAAPSPQKCRICRKKSRSFHIQHLDRLLVRRPRSRIGARLFFLSAACTPKKECIFW